MHGCQAGAPDGPMTTAGGTASNASVKMTNPPQLERPQVSFEVERQCGWHRSRDAIAGYLARCIVHSLVSIGKHFVLKSAAFHLYSTPCRSLRAEGTIRIAEFERPRFFLGDAMPIYLYSTKRNKFVSRSSIYVGYTFTKRMSLTDEM